MADDEDPVADADGADGTGDPVVDAREELLEHLVRFVRALRARGVEVAADGTLTAARALATVGVDDRERVRVALRAALVSRREDLEAFERLFPAFWARVAHDEAAPPAESGPALPAPAPLDAPGEGPTATDDDAASADEGGLEVASRVAAEGVDDAPVDPDAGPDRAAVYSPSGRPEPVEAGPSVAEDEAVERAVRALTDALASLRGRRWAAGGDERPDVRRALRRSVETGGTVLDLPGRARRDAGVRGVVLVDVSRSVLDTVDRRFLVAFLRAVRQRWRDVAIFFFDTSVREVTPAFDAPTADAALEALEAAEAAWGGGTRIGHAVETVRRRHPTLVDRETVVLVVSDGLEVGEVDVLEREMARLATRAAAVLWANPLAASAAYEPTCQGMAAALPYVDGLFAFSGPGDVEEMARQLARHGPAGRVGYEHDLRHGEASPARKR